MADVAATLREQYGSIFRFVRRRVMSTEDAEDLTQTVFADAATKLGALSAADDSSSLRLLYTIARRRLADKARRDQLMLQAVPQQHEHAGASEYPSPLLQALTDALSRLNETHRNAVMMKVVLGMRFVEIAQAEAISVSAAKMRVARGLESLRMELAKEEIDAP